MRTQIHDLERAITATIDKNNLNDFSLHLSPPKYFFANLYILIGYHSCRGNYMLNLQQFYWFLWIEEEEEHSGFVFQCYNGFLFQMPINKKPGPNNDTVINMDDRDEIIEFFCV